MQKETRDNTFKIVTKINSCFQGGKQHSDIKENNNKMLLANSGFVLMHLGKGKK